MEFSSLCLSVIARIEGCCPNKAEEILSHEVQSCFVRLCRIAGVDGVRTSLECSSDGLCFVPWRQPKANLVVILFSDIVAFRKQL